MPAPCLAGAQALRWSGERGPPQQRGLQQRHWAALRTRRRRPADELACRTLEPGRMLPGSGLLAFQPSAAGSGSVDLGHGDGIASVSDFLSGAPLPPQSGGGGGGGGAHALGPGTLAAARPAAGIPKETFQQLRQAVLTSLDLTDNAEHTVDYEDGSAELQVGAGAGHLACYFRISAQCKQPRRCGQYTLLGLQLALLREASARYAERHCRRCRRFGGRRCWRRGGRWTSLA